MLKAWQQGLHQLEPLFQGGVPQRSSRVSKRLLASKMGPWLSRCSVCEPCGLAQERNLQVGSVAKWTHSRGKSGLSLAEVLATSLCLTFGIFSLSDLCEELPLFVILRSTTQR